MTLKEDWVHYCMIMSRMPAEFYSGARKIIRTRSLTFDTLDDSLTLADAGYTKSKMTMLTKNYLHEESQAIAVELWERRLVQAKYGSVSFTTFNHFVKGKGTVEEIAAKGSKRASVFGPCMQSVIITWVNKRTISIDVMYRTTELFKKFPADLVFIRDVLLKPFNFNGMDVSLTCHFANITIHPMYAVTVFPHLSDPIAALDRLRIKDKFFYNWVVRWSSRYLLDEHNHGIQKFAQAIRVHKDVNERLDVGTLKLVQSYLRINHPGYGREFRQANEISVEEDED
jgi:hypothetical protein